MKNTATDGRMEEGFRHIRRLTDPLPFEEVISWVYQAPDPSPVAWWQAWRRLWRN